MATQDPSDDLWVLAYDSFEPEVQPKREALLTLGNGTFATRGAAEEAVAGGCHYPGTYVAGGYNRQATEIAGRTVWNEDLVNFPNWLCLNFRPEDGDWLDFAQVELLAYRIELRLRDGLLARHLLIQDRAGRQSRVTSERLVSMAQPHYAAIRYQLTPLNWSGPIRIRSLLDGSIRNRGVGRYRQLSDQHLELIDRGPIDSQGVHLIVRTSQSRFEVALAASTHLYENDQPLSAPTALIEEPERIGLELRAELRRERPLAVEKIVAIYTSKDRGISECAEEARLSVQSAPRYQQLRQDQAQAWHNLWRRCDIELETDAAPKTTEASVPLLLRLHIFHLLQTVSIHTVGLDVGVPARGLHGEAYRGHIFWDEAFILPFLNLCYPEITRSLLLYRYHRLDAAREYARQSGYRGAMFPWQSGSNGREQTQELHLNPRSGEWGPDYSRYQRHINAALVYNVWTYFQSTEDWQFLEHYGAEMILEVARFWSSIAQLNHESGRFEIHGVVGPDEYHERYPDSDQPGLRNNAYTNVMAVWCLERALMTLEIIRAQRRSELLALLRIDPAELERWRAITLTMTICFHDGGIISQFEDYDKLLEFDWERYRSKYGNIERLDRVLRAEGDSPDRYQVSKQADVKMLFYMLPLKEITRILHKLGYPFGYNQMCRNVQYYMQRTSHGSTLSRAVLAYVIHEIDARKSWELFLEALSSDVEDIQGGTTQEGIHLGAMAATVTIALNLFGGVDITGEAISITPQLPAQVRRLRAGLAYCNKLLQLTVTKDHIDLSVEDHGGTLPVIVRGDLYLLQPGSRRQFEIAPVR